MLRESLRPGFLFSGILVLFFLAIIYFVVGSDHRFQRQPSSQQATQKAENFIHFESIRLMDFSQKHFFLISNSNSFSQVSISNEIVNSTDDLDLKLACDQNFILKGDINQNAIKTELNHYNFRP